MLLEPQAAGFAELFRAVATASGPSPSPAATQASPAAAGLSADDRFCSPSERRWAVAHRLER